MNPTTPITDDIFAAFLKCRHKGHLKLAGAVGEKGDYERLRLRLAEEHWRRAGAHLLAAGGAGTVERPPSLPDAIRQGPAILVDAAAASGGLFCRIDGLERDRDTAAGKPRYVPVLFVRDEKVTREDRLLLAFQGIVLAGVQGAEPARGKVIHGSQFDPSRVHLGPLMDEARGVIREIEEVRDRGAVPQLVLNQHCGECEFRKRCREAAVARDDLSLLAGLSAKEIVKLNRRGIFSVAQYSHTFRPRKARKREAAGAPAPRLPLSLQALAIREGTVYVADKPVLPTAAVHAYLDVEGLPDRGFHYLIGLVVREGDARREFGFWADRQEDEPRIWASFLEVVASLGDFAMFHYGSYESDFLKKMARLHGGDPELIRKVEARAVNVLSLTYSRVFFPVHSNDLKSVASFLGFRWSAEDASGLQSIVWRYDWEATGNQATKQRLLAYNRDDCLALERVVALLSSVAGNAAGGTGTRVAAVEDIRPGTPGNFGKKVSFFPEMARITKCSYFDYQRRKILFRTSPLVKKAVRLEARRRKKSYRANVEVACGVPKRCPGCQSESLKVGHRYERIVLDLKPFRGGIKRWVTRYTTRSYKCRACGHPFLPDDYRAVPDTKYGHNLCAWAVHATICLRQTNENVEEGLADLFGYSVSRSRVSEFRKRAAEFYRPTYLAILERLRSGPLVHADETKVSLSNRKKGGSGSVEDTTAVRPSGRGTNGYVWAFASPDAAAYVYSPTRDGKVVRDTLAGFKGVLVSDFYTAYDSLDCPQQKCLLHLVRDFNDDLFSNPFDEELKQLAREFTVLLQAVVETIDRFGLKRLHLAKHQKDVDRFFLRLSKAEYRSEIASYYQQRLTKYKDKLFTFMGRDGVPWSNNNGENAIKRFAALRKVLGTAFTEEGIKDYMVLLSIAQTLRYRGGSFWQFLLSRETDLDAFLARRRRSS